jgi:Rrf2 family protein
LISKTAEYGLRAVIFIAGGSGKPLRANEIAQALGVPANYLSKILHALARASLLTSQRGPRGGFQLAVSPDEIHLAAIIEPLDPEMLRQVCLLGNAECGGQEACAVHERWKRAREPLLAFFEETTVADVLDRASMLPGVTSAARKVADASSH